MTILKLSGLEKLALNVRIMLLFGINIDYMLKFDNHVT